ncbi:MAG TPA: choice-of-anchor tandem repeat GloVer-containing protein [Candidatus Bathyarchaeia archaeon]|nr:choice-of-anchor tandem repeat GloVer-containing protein [Candidatus Bathyarchaeia archaeon]
MQSNAHAQTHRSDRQSNLATTVVTILLFIVLVLLVLALLAAIGQAQNTVPPTAQQAAAMPQFASRLARASRPQHPLPHASYQNARDPRFHFRNGGPLGDNTLYSNGAINGTTDAWTINSGFVVSDSFTVPANAGTVNGLNFGAWTFPGDVLQTVEISITSSEFGGTTYYDQVLSFTQSGCSSNQYGFNVCTESTGNFSGPNLAAGTYWLNLSNAVVNDGDPIFWDENSGPSMASENSVGTIPSEAFTIDGTNNNCPPTGCPPPPPPCFQSGEQGVQTIHDFAFGMPSALTLGTSDSLYGTTTREGEYGLGMVYRLSQRAGNWLFTTLYSFIGGDTGAVPEGVIIGPGGALFGTAQGGLHQCGQGQSDCGVIYKLTPSPVACPAVMCSWNETVLYRFTGDPDGWAPIGRTLVSDDAGNLYGGTSDGGDFGRGTVYKLSPSSNGWTETVIYSFPDNGPNSLLLGHDGNLYGIVSDGAFDGYVFQLVPSVSGWTENVLHTFQNTQQDGTAPNSLVQDPSGNLYGISTWYYQYYEDYRTAAVLWELSPSDHGWIFTELWLKQTDPRYYDDQFNSLAIDTEGSTYLASSTVAYDGSCIDHNFGCWWDLYGRLGAHFENIEFSPYGMTTDHARKRLFGVTSDCGENNRGTVWEISP